MHFFQTVLNLSRMSCEEEVISVRKQLEKMSKEGDDQTQALDLLKSLGKLPINLQVLTNTRCISLLIRCSWVRWSDVDIFNWHVIPFKGVLFRKSENIFQGLV